MMNIVSGPYDIQCIAIEIVIYVQNVWDENF